ncbi:MAG: hypothetical protein JRN20_13430 [Nitrososphaerota archaeon]|nr:hypothetical protein [Nitrososphaerota archaeon]
MPELIVSIPSHNFVVTKRGILYSSELNEGDSVLGTTQNKWAWVKYAPSAPRTASCYMITTDQSFIQCARSNTIPTQSSLRRVNEIASDFKEYSASAQFIAKVSEIPWKEAFMSPDNPNEAFLREEDVDENLIWLLGLSARSFVTQSSELVVSTNPEFTKTVRQHFKYRLEEWGAKNYRIRNLNSPLGGNYSDLMIVSDARLVSTVKTLNQAKLVPRVARSSWDLFLTYCKALEHVILKENSEGRFLRFFTDEWDLAQMMCTYYTAQKLDYELVPSPRYRPFFFELHPRDGSSAYGRVMAITEEGNGSMYEMKTDDPTWFPVVNLTYVR